MTDSTVYDGEDATDLAVADALQSQSVYYVEKKKGSRERQQAVAPDEESAKEWLFAQIDSDPMMDEAYEIVPYQKRVCEAESGDVYGYYIEVEWADVQDDAAVGATDSVPA
jgi:hypothetical protein